MQHLTPSQRELLAGNFNRIDVNKDGVVSFNEMFAALSRAFPHVAADEIEDIVTVLFDTADTNQDGVIDFNEFVSHFGSTLPPVDSAAGLGAAPSGSSGQGGLSVDERDLLRDAFIRLDTNGDGLLSFREIVDAAAAVLGPRVEGFLPELEELFVRADKDHDDRLSLVEFLSSFVEGIGVLPSDVLAECVANVRVRLSDEEIFALQRNFQELDRDKDGLINPDELTDLLRSSLRQDTNLSEAELRELAQLIMEVVDRDGDGRLNLSEFIRSFQEDQGLLPPVLAEARINVVKSKAQRAIEEDEAKMERAVEAIVRVWRVDFNSCAAPHHVLKRALSQALEHLYSPEELSATVQRVLNTGERDGQGNLDLEAFVQSIAPVQETKKAPKTIAATRQRPTTAEAYEREETARRALKVFTVLDDDEDGYLRPQDVLPLMLQLSRTSNPAWPESTTQAVCEAVFCAADIDEDGRLNEQEFVESFLSGYGILPADFVADVADRLIVRLSEEDMGRIAAAFYAIDENNDGFLSKEELEGVLSSALGDVLQGDKTTVQAISEIVLGKVDTDRDGKVSFSEFVHSFELDQGVLRLPLLAAEHSVVRRQRDRVAKVATPPPPPSLVPAGGAAPQPTAGAVIDTAFMILDTNKDGFLDHGEVDPTLRSVVARHNPRWDAKTVAKSVELLFGHADTDGDGKLSFAEFRATYSKENGNGGGLIPLNDLEVLVQSGGSPGTAANRSPTKRAKLSEVEIQNLTYVFRLLDGDNDDLIGYNDLKEPVGIWIRRENPSWTDDKVDVTIRALIAANDDDKDGKLSLGEFVGSFVRGSGVFPSSAIKEMTELRRAPRETTSWTTLSPAEVQQLRDAFTAIDVDQSGFIDPSELQRVVIDAMQQTSIDLQQVNATVDAILQSVDANGDGLISFPEFIAAFETLSAESPPLSPSVGTHRDLIRKADRALQAHLSPDRLRELAKTIINIDVGKNGIVDLKAVGDAIQQALRAADANVSEQEIERVVSAVARTAEVDEKSGALTLETFILMFVNKHYVLPPTSGGQQPQQLERRLTAEEIDELKAIFRAIDENNDGAIQAEEFELLLREALADAKLFNATAANEASIQTIVASVMSAADANGDGGVSFREFLEAFEKDSTVLDIPIMAAAARMEIAQRRMEALLCEHDLRNLARVFLYLDKNGDGFLQPDELRGAMTQEFAAAHPEWSKERVDSTVESIIHAADENGDGRLSLSEFIDAFLEGHYVLPPRYIRDVVSQTSRPLNDEEIAAIKAVFHSIDTNDDGFITVEKLRHSLTPVVGRATADAVCGAVMLVADENQDGKLTLQEFLRAYQIDNGILYVPLSAMSERTRTNLGSKLVPKDKLRDYSRVFALVDVNHDGFLDLDEVINFIVSKEALRKETSSSDLEGLTDQCRARMIQADMDGDYRLSLDEFISSEVQRNSAFPPNFIDRCIEELPNRRTSEQGAAMTPATSGTRLVKSSSAPSEQPAAATTNAPAQAAATPIAPSSAVAVVPGGSTPHATELSVNQIQLDVTTPQPSPPAGARPSRTSTRPNYKNIANVAIKDDDLRAEFDRYDKDGNGYLSFAEFKKAYGSMENFGLPLSEHELNKIFAPYAHADGKLSYDEFCILMLRRSRM